MRSTKASAAVSRLNARDTSHNYSLGITSNGLFYLLRAAPGAASERVGEELALDDFVRFVNSSGPKLKVRVSKLDVAFEKQLTKRDKT